MTLDRSEFSRLSAEVDAGHLRLKGNVADECVVACDDYIAGLTHLVSTTSSMLRREAFGTLRSGQQLAQKFVDLSEGGPGSIQDVLRQHIAVATDMREVFFKAGAAYRATEEDSQRSITAAGVDR